MTPKKKALGGGLPPVKKIASPAEEELDRLSSQWDSLVPEKWRGMLEPMPLGSPEKSAFYYDDVEHILYRANGDIVTKDEIRQAYTAFMDAMRK